MDDTIACANDFAFDINLESGPRPARRCDAVLQIWGPIALRMCRPPRSMGCSGAGVLKGLGKGKEMIDAEVVRLRRLRNVALRARALAKALESSSMDTAVFVDCAVLCWSIARIASGTLRAHPYSSYQKGPRQTRAWADHAMASLLAFTARRQNRSRSLYALQLQSVAREVGDVRALTWLPDLSDALGRAQFRLHRLAAELTAGALRELGPVAKPIHTGPPDDIGAGDWPYLAI